MKNAHLIRNATADPILAVTGLRKAYRSGFWGRRAAPAVDGLSFEVARGEVFALLGHNGAGKTTTLKAVLGLVRPEAGAITIAGVDARRAEARSLVGYLPEAPYFHENLSCAELLDFYGKLLGLSRGRRRERTAACLEQVGMGDEAKRRMGDCSKGMRQRVGLAQALLGEPELLILDEPQSGLDPLGRKQVRELLLEQKRCGVTVIFSSHIVPDVEAVADRVAMIRHGRLDEIRDLRRAPASRGFQAVIAVPDPRREVAEALSRPGLTVRRRDPARWTVAAADAGALGRLLSACHVDGLAVAEVSAQGGDLESDFLAGLVATAERATPKEVVSC
jgi:ABC-2 type transport system ATP-binding protein